MKNFFTVALLSMALFGSAVAGDKACCSKKQAKAKKACCAKKQAKAKKDCCAKVAVDYCKSEKCGWFNSAKKSECGTCMDKVSKR